MIFKEFSKLFLIVFILSLVPTYNLISYGEKASLIREEIGGEQISLVEVFLYIVVSTVVLLFLFKTKFGKLVIKLLELLMVFFSIFFLVSLWFLPLEINEELGFIASSLAVLARIKNMFRNEIAILAIGGVASLMGFFFSPSQSLLFLAILAIYDYIAVFKTKHMIELAKNISKEDLSFLVRKSYAKNYSPRLKEKEIERKREGLRKGEGKRKVIGFVEMGGGDFLVPAMLASSFLKIGFFYSFLIIIGTLAGLFVLERLLLRLRRPLPAIPILGGGIFLSLTLGYLISLLLKLI